MRKIVSWALAVTLALASMSACMGLETPFIYIDVRGNAELTDTELFVENDYLSLRFDCATTQFALTDKRTGRVWYSNPPDLDDDPVALVAAKDKLRSQFVLTYGQVSGAASEINSYTLSVASGNYYWELLDDGVKVYYTIGRVEQTFLVPEAVPESRYQEFREKMDVTGQRAIDNVYRIIDINNLRPNENRDELLEMYPALEFERMYTLRENQSKAVMARLEGFFEGIGYTYEDYMEDMSAIGEADETETPVFNVSVVYRLDGPDFVVEVPLDEIEYRYSYPPLNISVLPFFGAGGLEDEGFLLVPDASGALIRFNNGKQNQAPYGILAYGYDYATNRTAIVDDNYAYFPAFGISNNGASFVCVVEEGAENSQFEADVSRRYNGYNYVYSRFTTIKWDDVDVSKQSVSAKAFDRTPMTGLFSQRYILVDSPDYADMAAAYREYLIKKYSLSRTNENGLPAALNIVGAIDRTTNVAGLPLVLEYPLTTYAEAAGIINSLSNAGISNMRVSMTGWFNGGVTHDAPANINLISGLGGKKGFTELLNTASRSGVPIFFEADFTFIYNIGLFNGYGVNRDSAKRLNREVARLYEYSYVWFGEWTNRRDSRERYYLANPAYSMRAIDSFISKLRNLGGSNVTFGSIGRSLNSDLNMKGRVTRQEAAAMQQAKMAELAAGGSKMMVYGGNAYAAVYADFILNMELKSQGYTILDESVPFYQMALHGLVPYAAEPINLALDYRRAVLETAEAGAGLQFLFMNARGEELQETRYTAFYAADLARWGGEPAELYNRFNRELGHTVNQFIVGHSRLAPQVTQTVYEDGTRVIVNYADVPFTASGGVTVGALDFVVIR